MLKNTTYVDISFRNICYFCCDKRGRRGNQGNKFTRSTLHDMLNNVKYMGVYRYNRKDRTQSSLAKKHFDEVWVENGIKEPIISREQFESVQKIMEFRKGVHNESNYLLSGIIECGICGKKMYGTAQNSGKGKPRRRHYTCPNHEKRNGGTCNSKGIDASTIENQVKKVVLDAINELARLDAIDKSIFNESLESKKRLRSSIKKSIDNLNKVIEQSTDRFVEPGIKESIKKSLERKIEKDTIEIEELEQKLKIAENSIKQYNRVIKTSEFDQFELDEVFKNEILSKQLTRIVVDSVKIGTENIEIQILEK